MGSHLAMDKGQGWTIRPIALCACRALSLSVLACVLSSCASQDWIRPRVRLAFQPIQEETLLQVAAEREAWEASHVQLLSAAKATGGSVATQAQRRGMMANRTEGMVGEVSQARKEFDSGLKAAEKRHHGQLKSWDVANKTRSSSDVRMTLEGTFGSWRRRCNSIDSQVTGLAKRQQKEAAWSKLVLLPMQRQIIQGAPPPLASLIAQSDGSLAARETSGGQAEDIFLARSLRNMNSGLKALQPQAQQAIKSWQPRWDAERAIVNSPRRNAILGSDADKALLRDVLISKAYVCDVMIRQRGATPKYDMLEVAYYVNQLAWCSRQLGPAMRRELDSLVKRYTTRLDHRSSMVETGPKK